MSVPESTVESEPLTWSPWLRAAVSVLVVWHLVGVMVAPISTPPQFAGGDSVIGGRLKTVYRPYITAMFLDHSYKFFAPNPGDSHLVRYDLYFADGTQRVNRDDQILPDRLGHWPRLLYHRHFMLTEFINDFRPLWAWNAEELPTAGRGPVGPLDAAAIARPPAAGENLPQPGAGEGPPYVTPYVRAMAEYLARRHGATRVDLYYRKHLLPSIEDFERVGGRLDSPESYRDRLLISYAAEQRS